MKKPHFNVLTDRLPLERFIPVAFLIFLLLFIILTVIIYNSINNYKQNIKQVEHTQKVLNTIDDISLELSKVQFARRGYVINKVGSYLDDYNKSKRTINDKFVELRSLISDNPNQLINISKMDSLSKLSIFMLDTSIVIYESTKINNNEVQIPLIMTSQSFLDTYLSAANKTKDEELMLLEQRQLQANQNLANTQLFIIGTSLFVFLILGISLYISSKLLKNKQVAEDLLKKSYDELEDKVIERTSELKNVNESLVNEINNRIAVEKSLRESEKRFRELADSAPVLIWMADENMNATYFNKVWLDFTGKSIDEETGKGWENGIHPDDTKRVLNSYKEVFEKRAEFDIEYRLINNRREYRWIYNHAIPRFVGDKFIGYIGTCIDIHAKKRTERYLRIQHAVSKSLADSLSIGEALNNVLKGICIELNWGMGIIWIKKGNLLTPGGFWSKNPNDSGINELFSSEYQIEKGIGLSGRIWKNKVPAWISNIEKDENFPQKENLLANGWKSALGFPLSDNGEVIGVVEYYNKTELTPKNDLLEVLENSGQQIGAYIERKQIEEELKNSYTVMEERVRERTHELAEALNRLLKEIEEKEKVQIRLKLFAHAIRGIKECIFITDLNNNTIFVNSAFENIYGYYEEELLNKKTPVLFSDVVDEDTRGKILKESLRGGWKGELKSKSKDNELFDIYLSTTVIRNDDGKVQAIIGICQDITESKHQKVLLEKRYNLLNLLNDVIAVVNKSFNQMASISYALNKICEYTNWDIGHCYFVQDEKIVSSKIWNANLAAKFHTFREITEETSFLVGEGSPGKAIEEGKPSWKKLIDYLGDPQYKRLDACVKHGLKTGIWVPIMKNKVPIGTLEFFNEKDIEIDDEILDTIVNISTEIGNLFERNDYISQIQEQQKHFKAVADTANDAIITADTNGKIIYTNKSVNEIFGYADGELIDKHLDILMPEDLVAKHNSAFSRAVQTGKSLLIGETLELKGKRKDGKKFPIEVSLARWEMEGKIYFTGMIRDVTLRKQIENELVEGRNSLVEAQSIAKMGNWEWVVETGNVKWSGEMYNLYELTPEKFIPSYENFLSRLHPDDVDIVRNILKEAIDNKSTFDFFERILTPDGKVKILRSQGGVRTDSQGKVTKLVGTCLDITEIKQAENKIRENEEQLRLIMESIKDYSIIMVDERGYIQSWNNAARQIKGYERDEVLGKHISIFYPEDEVKDNRPQENLNKAKEFGVYEREGWRVRKDGTLFWADVVFAPLYDNNNKLKGFVKVTRDITERKQAEEALKESEQRLKEAQKIARLGSWEKNLTTNQLTWSDEMYRIFSFNPDEEPKDFEELHNVIFPDDRRIYEDFLIKLKEYPSDIEYSFRIVNPGGRLKYLTMNIWTDKDESGKVSRLFGSVQDITEIKLVEEELIKTNATLIETQKELVHKEKLAALGRFSSGIAHEIRNPLANISALAQLISKAKIEDEKMKKHLKYILINSDIANNIIKQLLHFASPEDLVFGNENLSEIIENIVNSMEPRCAENHILITKQINLTDCIVYIDRSKLENALLNFLSNSIEAMPQGGNLSVKAKTDKIKNEIVIDIIDTGAGIPPENLDKIFEPFFTTKPSGTGLGLGLAYQTIRLHQGLLNISSEPGKGTHVEIKLPIRINKNGKNTNN